MCNNINSFLWTLCSNVTCQKPHMTQLKVKKLLLSLSLHRISMISHGRQIVGLTLAIDGFLGSIITCGLPMWKVTRISAGIIIPQVSHEGLWMFCMNGHTGQMQCICTSDQTLTQDLQAARASYCNNVHYYNVIFFLLLC